jgi:hypothetical protein
MQAQGHWLHIDDAEHHNAALSFQKSEETRFTRLSQPSYSPDLAPCGLFLFRYLKKELEGKNFRSENEVISAVNNFENDPDSSAFRSV